MNCELCGCEIPENVTFCPSCGLPIDYDEHRPTVEDHSVGDTTPVDPLTSIESMVDDSPASAYGANPENPPDYPYGNETEELPHGSLSPPQQSFAPPGSFPPPGQGYSPPGTPPPPGLGYAPPPGTWGRPPTAHSAVAGKSDKNKKWIVLAVALTIGIVVLGGSVFAYLSFLRPGNDLDDIKVMLEAYLNAAGVGDTSTVASYHTGEMQPSAESLSKVAIYGDEGKLYFSDLELKEVSRTSSEIEIEITDIKMVIEAYGEKETYYLHEWKDLGFYYPEASRIKLKEENGQWRVNQTTLVNPFRQEPET